MQSVTPECTHSGLGSSHFARRYFGNRCFFLFLRLLRCFSSPGSLPYVMDWRMDDWSPSSRVSPFRHLRIKDYLHLPAAFRSLSRLSSALSAKASTLRSFLLDYSILVIIALITFVTNFWSVTYYSLKNFTVITMSWSNRYLIILSFCMKFSKYISQQILFSSADNGDGEIRTLDPLLARQVLSQLSYTPIGCGSSFLFFKKQSLYSFVWVFQLKWA